GEGWGKGREKTVEGLPRLLDTLFCKRPHFRGNIETIGGSHDHLLLWIGVGCYAVKACDLLKYQQPKRPLAPAQNGGLSGIGPSSVGAALYQKSRGREPRCVSSTSANARSRSGRISEIRASIFPR